ncbi:hypothetical protein Q2941_32330 [Bradyrhizobium sp. UFLA05-153]
MMPESVHIYLSETRHLIVSLKGSLPENVLFGIDQRATMRLSILPDLRNRVLQPWQDFLPFGLIQHGNFHPAPPAKE